MGLMKKPDPIVDDLDGKTEVAYLHPDGSILDGDGERVTPYLTLFVNGKAKALWTTAENAAKSKMTLAELLEKLETADEDESWPETVKREAKRLGISTGGTTPTSSAPTRSTTSSTRSTSAKPRRRTGTMHVRVWSNENMNQYVPPRGRVPIPVQQRHDAAHPLDDYQPTPAQIIAWKRLVIENGDDENGKFAAELDGTAGGTQDSAEEPDNNIPPAPGPDAATLVKIYNKMKNLKGAAAKKQLSDSEEEEAYAEWESQQDTDAA